MTTPSKPPSLPSVVVLDTNVILRYLTQDNPDLARRAYRLFQQAHEGKITLVTSEAVIAKSQVLIVTASPAIIRKLVASDNDALVFGPFVCYTPFTRRRFLGSCSRHRDIERKGV